MVDISPSYRFLSVRVGGMTPSSVIVGICVLTMMPSTSLASLRVSSCVMFLKRPEKMIEHFNGNIHTQSKGTHPD